MRGAAPGIRCPTCGRETGRVIRTGRTRDGTTYGGLSWRANKRLVTRHEVRCLQCGRVWWSHYQFVERLPLDDDARPAAAGQPRPLVTDDGEG